MIAWVLFVALMGVILAAAFWGGTRPKRKGRRGSGYTENSTDDMRYGAAYIASGSGGSDSSNC